MKGESQAAEQDSEAQARHLREILRLRLIVGYLGENGQHNWWPSKFFSATALHFLNPVFAKTAPLAQYHGVKEAARRVHDGRIGIGRVFHLFRLPESMEQAIFELLQDPSVTTALYADIQSRDTAATALQSIIKKQQLDNTGDLPEGPVQIGTVSDLDDTRWLANAAHRYEAAFHTGSYSFPYLIDRT